MTPKISSFFAQHLVRSINHKHIEGTSAPSGVSISHMVTHYEVLGLPESLQHASGIPAQTLRGAYKRALLKNHPDKTNKTLKPTYSIDQISAAFSVLSKPASRDEYDKELKLQNKAKNVGINGQEVFRTGVETVDLDDLEIDEAQGIWYRNCRCGDDRGFLIAEADLEEAADEGELSVGCRGCSLWLKVLFGVVEEESKDGEDGDSAEQTKL